MKKILLFSTLLFVNLNLFAQNDGHFIQIRLKGAPENKVCYLAHFMGYNQYIKVDSAKLDPKGVLNFKGSEKLKGGIYLVVTSPSKYYDFIVSGTEQNFELVSDTTDFVKNLKAINSKENENFFAYRKFLKSKSDEGDAIAAANKLKKDEASKMEGQKKIEGISTEVNNYMKDFVRKNEGTFSAKIIKANIEPDLPKVLPTLPNGKKDSAYLFNYYKSHFFQNMDFTDERMIRTPFLQSRLERYFKDLVYTLPDSVNHDCDKVLSLAKQNTDVYRYTLWFVTNKYENTKIVGLDPVFIHLVENHYLKDATWLDSAQIAKFRERVSTLKPLQTGLVFPNMLVTDLQGKEHSPLDSKTKYTLVYLYSNDCGHCKDHAPHVMKFYQNHKDTFTIYNVNINSAANLENTKQFVQKYQMDELVNLWDGKSRYNFIKDFDAFSTPTVFFLDQNHRIIAKAIPVDEWDNYLNFYEKQQRLLSKSK